MVIDRVVNSIPRISASALSQQIFMEEFQKPGFPVIITDLLDTHEEWNLDFLCEKLESQEFLLRYYGNARYQQDKRLWTSIGSGVQMKRIPFNDYAELLRTHEAHEYDIYLAKCSITNTSLADEKALINADQNLEKIGLKKPVSSFNLWVGPGGHIECLHYDPTDGTLTQLHGAKRVVLFPPSQSANLYPFPIASHLRYGLKLRCWFSQIYPDAPDLTAFPRFQNAIPYKYEIILNSGETLYIPAGWWHEVTALGDEVACSINRFWGVFPQQRSLFTWNRWRAFLGSSCAIPHTLFSLLSAIYKGQGQEKLKEISQML